MASKKKAKRSARASKAKASRARRVSPKRAKGKAKRATKRAPKRAVAKRRGAPARRARREAKAPSATPPMPAVAEAVNVILLGPPGAGKGTQAEMLRSHLKILHLSTGNAFRAAIAAGTELGKQVEPILKVGGLVPDAITIALVDDRLTKDDCLAGALFDGYPRTIAQAESLDRTLSRLGRRVKQVVVLEVNDEVIVERMAGRRSCPKDGSVYHVSAKPPKNAGVCDQCGTALMTRPDDQPATVQARLDKYHHETAPLIGYYEPRGVVAHIDGTGTPEEVFDRVKRVV